MKPNINTNTKPNLFWFRRDLRLDDNRGLYEALSQSQQVIPVFIFDTTLLNQLDHGDRRIEFIHACIQDINSTLSSKLLQMQTYIGDPRQLIPALAKRFNVNAVYCNEDYEPQAIARDEQVARDLIKQDIQLISCKDQVIFAKHEILTQQKKPYTVFTPYKKNWLSLLRQHDYRSYPSESLLDQLINTEKPALPTIIELGFESGHLDKINLKAGHQAALKLLQRFLDKVIIHYDKTRDLPAIAGTSFLSVHNRFGTISIRHLIREAMSLQNAKPSNTGISTWLSELIWREFYFQLLFHYPLLETESFKTDYANLRWENNPQWFEAWKTGQTGYPLVDAAMRQLNQTGYMHNRLRMLVASFLTKDLLIDYRWGERYFAHNLLDFDLAANNGGWQWAASTGCDAQPYFRIFSPSRQSERFDPDAQFIKKYVPELQAVPPKYLHDTAKYESILKDYITLGKDYPHPIVNHSEQRLLALELFNIKK